ncbi:MAG TPA: glycerol-3-phosphate 1-O-acyltransferase [Aliiroseovarius sp.]|nr:glycerol-3-phosphate 1-O-acyltransferase [Aliiroseovarius sp.]
MPDLTTAPTFLALVAIASYLLGSVPFGIVMARLFGLGDLRAIGSGNIGATNVLRTGNKLAAFLTLVLDAGKGGIAVLVARALWGEDAAQLAGLAAFLGHCYPIFLGFKGGKGVATWLGTLWALAWPLGLAASATWLVVVALTRVSSLGGMAAAVLSPLLAWLLGGPSMIVLLLALAALILWRHRANISRLRHGQEPRLGRKS